MNIVLLQHFFTCVQQLNKKGLQSWRTLNKSLTGLTQIWANNSDLPFSGASQIFCFCSWGGCRSRLTICQLDKLFSNSEAAMLSNSNPQMLNCPSPPPPWCSALLTPRPQLTELNCNVKVPSSSLVHWPTYSSEQKVVYSAVWPAFKTFLQSN